MQSIKPLIIWICMWIADLVPWVSWGTIAFISWIYERLLTSIHRCDLQFIRYILQREIQKARNHIQWSFLFQIIWGILLAISAGSSLLHILLETHPHYLFSFFTGLVVFSIVRFIYEHAQRKHLWWIALGIALWYWLTHWVAFVLPETLLWFFLWGVLGSSAMILPGISWSYLLLIAGIYEPIIAAVSALTWWDLSVLPLLVSLWTWVVLGLLILWRILKSLYTHHPEPLILTMTGLMTWALDSIIPTLPDNHTQVTLIRMILLWVAGWGLFLLVSLLWKKTKHSA